jgi:hypothetical protein
MRKREILCLTALYCLTGCGTTTVVEDLAPVPMLPETEAVVELLPPVEKAEEKPLPPVAETVEELLINEADVEMLAKLVWGEARGCSVTEQAAVIWTVLNRVDSEDPIFPDTIQEVVTQPSQFHGYDPNHPVEQDKVDLARDVLTRWINGGEGRILPKEYVFFHGDGLHNHFRIEYKHNGLYWDWSLASPYEE